MRWIKLRSDYKRLNNRKLGAWYEEEAISMLEKQGAIILERNYRSRVGEIDIIAKEGFFLVFVEVKYRKDPNLGMPEDAVNKSKQKKICMVAKDYFYKRGISMDCPIRFDVVAILGSKTKWYKNAFLFQ